MATSPADPAEHERHLDEALSAYLAAIAAERSPGRRELIAGPPELAAELAALLSDFDRLAERLRSVAHAAGPPEPTQTGAPGGPTDGCGLAPPPTADWPGPAAGEPGSGDDLELPGGAQVSDFGDYELRGVLGRGGMGVVYQAKQRSLNRPVALKMIRAAAWASDEEVRRFRNEAEAVAKLDHPQIVTVHEVGQYEGRHYFSMRLVEGPGLDRVLGHYTAHPREAARLVAQVARAVHHAHQRGILHRDLKPSNILIDADGHPHVTDFGLAKRLKGDGSLSDSGSVVGTPQYMSPEQASGSRRAITTATDVYGLGALLYAALTGQPPFRADSVLEILEQVRERTPTTPSKINRRVPRDLEVICLRCLEKDPRRRYGSADALAEDLGRFLGGEPVLARRTGLPERMIKWARRRPAVAALLVTVLAITLLGFAGVTWQWIQADAARRDLAAANETLDTNLYFKLIDLADREAAVRNLARLEELLAECPRHRRGWEWHYLKRRRYASPRALRGHAGYASCAAFSPDGRRLATGGASLDRRDQPGEVKVWDVATGRDLLTRRVDGMVLGSVAFSPDGRRLTVMDWDRASDRPVLKVWDVATGRDLLTLTGHTRRVSMVRFSPDGARLASASEDGTVRIWDAVAGRGLLIFRDHASGVGAVAFSPDGRWIATAGLDRTVRVWDAATGRGIHILRGHKVSVNRVAFSPDGRRLATAGNEVKLWDAETGREVARLPIPFAGLGTLAFSPDGTRLAVSVADGVWLWDLTTGNEALSLRELPLPVDVAFSPDGTRLAAAGHDGGVMIWDATPFEETTAPGPLLTLGRPTDLVSRVVFSPDGRRLVSGGVVGSVRIWDAQTGHLLHDFQMHGGLVLGLAFSPDGRELASIAQEEGTLKVWDAETGRRLRSLTKMNGLLPRVGYSPDGRRLAVSVEPDNGPPEVRILDATDGRTLLTLSGHAHSANAPAFSPDGTRLAAGCMDSTVWLWDTLIGQRIHTLRGHTGPAATVAFSPDGGRLASAGGDKTVRVWDATTGREALFLRGHAASVESVAFSPDGKSLVSMGQDKTVRAWDATTGRELGALIGHTGGALSLDGRRLATVTDDQIVQIWDAAVLTVAPEPSP